MNNNMSGIERLVLHLIFHRRLAGEINVIRLLRLLDRLKLEITSYT